MRCLPLCGCLLILPALAVPPAGLAATFVVDDTADPAPITGTMTLRQAITAANSMPGPHQILFQIPFPGVQTIQPLSELPPIMVDMVWIDGYSQPGASPGASPPLTATILVELDGQFAGPAHGLILLSSLNWIQGLVVRNFAKDGIRILGTPSGTNSNTVYANFVGTDVTGTMAAGNCTDTSNIWAGVDILCAPSAELTYCSANVVEANLISGNQRCGVQISSCPPSDCWLNVVYNNYVGTDVTGMLALGNWGSGVVLAEGTHDNLIQQNVVSANGANGLDVTGNPLTIPPANTTQNRFLSNLVGLGSDGVLPLGNSGRGASCGIFEISSFYAGFCSSNDFTTNTVAYNLMAGFSVWEHALSAANADQNTFMQNATYLNGGLGIDLGDDGVTLNDAGDIDTGPNEELNFPMILTADYLSGVTTVSGVADPTSEVHLYRTQSDPTGYGEGDLWLGSTWPDGLGNWALAVTGLVLGDSVTTIAMDWAGGSLSNTSEFSPSLVVQLDQSGVPEGAVPGFRLALAGPNPFHSATTFRYELPGPDRATIRVYGARGNLVRTLVDGTATDGPHIVQWDGLAADGGAAAAGVYFVVLSSTHHRAGLRVVKIE